MLLEEQEEHFAGAANVGRVLNFPNKPVEGQYKLELNNVDSLIADSLVYEAREVLLKLRDKVSGDNELEGVILRLAFIHELDHFENPILDFNLAYDYYELASERFGSAEAFLAMANLHYMGLLEQADINTCLELLTHLVEESYCANGLVFWILGRIFLFGASGSVDYDLAEKYFSKGWELGHVPSLGGLGYTKKLQGKRCVGLALRIKALMIALHRNFTVVDSPSMRQR